MQEPHAAFLDLFEAYTGQPDAIGPHLNAHMGRLSAGDPLLVATGTDLVLFPGSGAKPRILNFRLGTRGFKELTAISHLGVAVPYLRRMYELDCAQWRDDAIRLKAAIETAERVNSPEFWRDDVAAVAFRGREEAIFGMTAYACAVTLRVLESLLSDPTGLDFEYLRTEWLDVREGGDFPIAMNDVMAATFALVFLDAAYRTITWLGEHDIAWDRAMVLISGKAGRPTAGVTWQTNSMCHLLWQASGQQLSPDRLYIAPHGPDLDLAQLADEAAASRIEARFREIWFSTNATVEMGRLMFDGYPAFHRPVEAAPVIDVETREATELPRVRSIDDRRAIITRLRFVMEDPAQQLANAGAQFIVDQLCSNGNVPEAVVVPGLDNINYRAS
jgi:hypothetical protein